MRAFERTRSTLFTRHAHAHHFTRPPRTRRCAFSCSSSCCCAACFLRATCTVGLSRAREAIARAKRVRLRVFERAVCARAARSHANARSPAAPAMLRCSPHTRRAHTPCILDPALTSFEGASTSSEGASTQQLVPCGAATQKPRPQLVPCGAATCRPDTCRPDSRLGVRPRLSASM